MDSFGFIRRAVFSGAFVERHDVERYNLAIGQQQ